MSKEVAVMEGNPSVNGNGRLIGMNDLSKLGKRAQKNVLLQNCIIAQTNMVEAYEEANECKAKSKSLRRAIKNSDAGKKLDEVNKRGASAFKSIPLIKKEIETIKKQAEDLGLDIREEIKNLKLLEA